MTPALLALRKSLRVALLTSLYLLGGVIVECAIRRSFGYFRVQLILTLLGIAVGCILGLLDTWALPRFPRMARVALGFLLTSQTTFYVVVWSAAKRSELFYRAWWLFVVASITTSHLLSLRMPAGARRDWLDRLVPAGALLSGLMLAALSFWPEFPAKPPLTYWYCLAAPAALSILGSWILWLRRRPRKENKPLPMARWASTAWLFASQAAVFLAGYYVGGGTESATPFEIMPSALAGLPPEKLDPLLRADYERLHGVTVGLEELMQKSDALYTELTAKRRAEGREFYRPEEDDQVRWHFVTYLSYRAALLRIAATYGNYESVREPELRARCFMVGYASAGAAYQATLALVNRFEDDAVIRKKLNEAEPRWGISAATYDKIAASAADEMNERMFHEMGAYYGDNRAEWRQQEVWPAADFDWLDAQIDRSLSYVEAHPVGRTRHWVGSLARRVKSDLYTPTYAAQSMLSTMIGDLRIVKDAPLIPIERIKKKVEPLLEPGDIFLERRNWYLSNAFLPGFWPHGALYVGTPEDLRELGIADHPEVRRRWAKYMAPAHDGEPHRVLESVSEGVIFNSVTESMHADYVAVLRPRALTPEQIGEAIVRAFSHQGKPYDFEFDFFTSDKLVCTELVYRSYEGMLHFDLVRIMGRDTLPALEIGKKFARERGGEKRELDLVLFVDGTKGLADEDGFLESLNRPGAFDE